MGRREYIDSFRYLEYEVPAGEFLVGLFGSFFNYFRQKSLDAEDEVKRLGPLLEDAEIDVAVSESLRGAYEDSRLNRFKEVLGFGDDKGVRRENLESIIGMNKVKDRIAALRQEAYDSDLKRERIHAWAGELLPVLSAKQAIREIVLGIKYDSGEYCFIDDACGTPVLSMEPGAYADCPECGEQRVILAKMSSGGAPFYICDSEAHTGITWLDEDKLFKRRD